MSLTFNDATPDVGVEITGTLTFNDDNVAAVYIDWDDGADNEDNANYQWIQFDKPVKTAKVYHTYTANDVFTPIVQTVTSEGFFSRYYSSGSSTPTGVTPWTQDDDMGRVAAADTSPTASLRLQNKEVLSGIDNSILFKEGAKDLYWAVPPVAASYGGGKGYTLEITAEVSRPTYSISGAGGTEMGTTTSTETLSVEVAPDGANGVQKIQTTAKLDSDTVIPFQVRSVQKVKMLTGAPTSDVLGEWLTQNQMKIFLLVLGDDGYYHPITYVSDGSPIKSYDDKRRYVTLDFTQSRTAASNKTISNYYYDIGKSWFSPVNTWVASGGNIASGTQRISTPTTTDSTVRVDYTYYPRYNGLNGMGQGVQDGDGAYPLAFGTGAAYSNVARDAEDYVRADQFAMTDTNQFFDRYHQVRDVVKSNSDKYSAIKAFQGVYRITPALAWTSGSQQETILGGGQVKSNSKTKLFQSGTSFSQAVTSGAYLNGSGNQVNMELWNTLSFTDRTGSGQRVSEYFLIINDEKFDKLWFETSPYAQKLMSNLSGASGTTIAGVYYSKIENKDTATMNAYWKPLKFEDLTMSSKEYRDTTNKTYDEKKMSMTKSGYLKFDEPDDWGSVSLKSLAGGATIMTAETSGAIGISGNVNDWEAPVKATCVATGAGLHGKWAKFNDVIFMDGNTYTESDIGKYQYMALRTSGNLTSGSGVWKEAYWCASGTDGSGYDGTNLFLQIGDKDRVGSPLIVNGSFVSGTTYEFALRNVNLYNIIDGASKVFSGNPAAPANDWSICTVDQLDGAPAYNRYMFNSGSYLATHLLSEWGESDKYAMKIVLSGTSFASGSGGGATPGIEIWNISPLKGSMTEVVKEIDDHAYCLNKWPITSDFSVSRETLYFYATTRKGKVYLAKTGVAPQTLSFTSVGLGDSSDSSAFTKYGELSDTYGQLRKIRYLQENGYRAYYDVKQKDGTSIRFFGVIPDVSETIGIGGTRAVNNYSFSFIIEEVCLLDTEGNLMTDLFPIGGLDDAPNYT